MSVDLKEAKILAEDTESLHKMGYAQELARRMHGFSNFAVSFSIICVLAGGLTALQSAYCASGPGGVFIGWIVGSIFALIVSLSMAQIASAYPTAGALYHWSSILGGRGLGWTTAFFNLLGLIFEVASVNVGCYLLFTSLVLGGIFHIDTSHWGFWQQTGAMVLITVSQGLFIHMGIRTTTALISFSGYLIFFVTIVLTIALLAGTQHFDFSRLVTFINYSGAPRRRRGAAFQQPLLSLPDRTAPAALHDHRIRWLGAYLGRDGGRQAQCAARHHQLGILVVRHWLGHGSGDSGLNSRPGKSGSARRQHLSQSAYEPARGVTRQMAALCRHRQVSNYLCGMAALVATLADDLRLRA